MLYHTWNTTWCSWTSHSPSEGFDKYPRVKLLILAEGVMVMADPVEEGHNVKTQCWNWALISGSNDPAPSAQIIRLDPHQRWRATYVRPESGFVQSCSALPEGPILYTSQHPKWQRQKPHVNVLYGSSVKNVKRFWCSLSFVSREGANNTQERDAQSGIQTAVDTYNRKNVCYNDIFKYSKVFCVFRNKALPLIQ